MPRASTTQRGPSSAQLHGLRQDAIRELEDMEAAIVRTRNQLRFMENVIRRVRKALESGRPASEVAKTANAAEARLATSTVIREVQAARHRAQRAQFKLAAAEGSTMAEIARRWGVSRQLVSRMVKEPNPRRRRG
jgi:hypothetical protein